MKVALAAAVVLIGLAVPAVALASGPTGATKATPAIEPSRGTGPDSPPRTGTLVDGTLVDVGPTGGTGPTGCDGPTGNVGVIVDDGPTGASGPTGAGSSPGDSGATEPTDPTEPTEPTDPTEPADPPDGVGPTGDADPTLYYCMYALDMTSSTGAAPLAENAFPASALVTSAHTSGWWWFLVSALTVLVLIAAPRTVRQKAASYFKR